MANTAASINIRSTRQHRGFTELKQRVQSNANRAAYNYARAVVKDAEIRVPRRTGYLASQIKWVRLSPGRFLMMVDGDTTTQTGAYYGVYVEYGTRYMAAQPYFRPAIEFAKGDFMREMKAVFRAR